MKKSSKKIVAKPKLLKCTLHKNVIKCILDNPKKYNRKSCKTIKRDFGKYVTQCSSSHKGKCDAQSRRITEIIINLPTNMKLKG